jgi:hypothetical protein
VGVALPRDDDFFFLVAVCLDERAAIGEDPEQPDQEDETQH